MAGVLLVFMLITKRMPRIRLRRPSADTTHEFTCDSCQRIMAIHANEVAELIGPEMGLLVSQKPSFVKRKVGEYRCPYCDSNHYFAMDVSPPEWIAANIYEPQQATNKCAECRNPLKRIPWARGQHDGEVLKAPGLLPEHGLVCSRCDAVCCARCCQDATRNRTSDGSLLCPRCFRGPVDRFHHF